MLIQNCWELPWRHWRSNGRLSRSRGNHWEPLPTELSTSIFAQRKSFLKEKYGILQHWQNERLLQERKRTWKHFMQDTISQWTIQAEEVSVIIGTQQKNRKIKPLN